jgi:hypothetical protein
MVIEDDVEEGEESTEEGEAAGAENASSEG